MGVRIAALDIKISFLWWKENKKAYCSVTICTAVQRFSSHTVLQDNLQDAMLLVVLKASLVLMTHSACLRMSQRSRCNPLLDLRSNSGLQMFWGPFWGLRRHVEWFAGPREGSSKGVSKMAPLWSHFTLQISIRLSREGPIHDLLCLGWWHTSGADDSPVLSSFCRVPP